MNLLLTYTKVALLNILRNRAAFFFGIVMPTLFFLMFGHYGIEDKVQKIGSFIIFCNYAVQTIFFLSLGMSISMKRSNEWTIYLRTLPASPFIGMLALIIEKSLMALISLTLVISVNISMYGMVLSWPMTLYLMLGALIGGIPMGFLAIGIGYRCSPESARTIFVFANLGLLFASFAIPHHGLWRYLNAILPSSHWANIVLSHYTPNASVIAPWIWMLGFGILFYYFATWSYRNRKDLRRE